MKIEVVIGAPRKFWWRIKAANGEILASSEQFSSKGAAHRGARDFVKKLSDLVTVTVVEVTTDD